MNDSGFMFGGINIRRNVIAEENDILNDFSSNVEIYVNGQKVSKIVEQKKFGSKINIPENENIIVEPGQVDPTEFFGSSLKGLI